MRKIDLSVVVPCYNEEKNLLPLVKRFKESLSNDLHAELILVDNGSIDNSSKVLRNLVKKNSFLRVVSVMPNIGYGNGILQGLKNAKGEFVCWTHADLQTDLKDTIIAFRLAKKSEDSKKIFVKGNRYGRSLFDSFFTFGMSIFETVYLGKKLYDINAQPNLFHRSFLKELKYPPKDFSFDLYMYHTALENNYKVTKFPVFFGRRKHGHSTWNTGIKSKIRFIQRTIKFSKELKERLENLKSFK